MRNKIKSISLALGALAAVATPTVAVISCGANAKTHKRPRVYTHNGKDGHKDTPTQQVGADYKEHNKTQNMSGDGLSTDYDDVSKDMSAKGQTFANFQRYRGDRDQRIAQLQTALTSSKNQDPVAVTQAIVRRYIGERVNEFTFTLIAKKTIDTKYAISANRKDILEKQKFNKFSIEVTADENGKRNVHIEGSSAVAMARGWYDWMKRNGYGMIGWQSNSIHLPTNSEFKLMSKVVTESPYERHYFGNSAAAGYSTPFWNSNDWANWLAWCAVHGYDLMLDYVGHEQVLTELYKEVGYTEDNIRKYLSGPAYATWSRLGNIANWDSIPNNETFRLWNDKKKQVQHSIKTMMDNMDIKGIPASFAGFVPEKQNGVEQSIEGIFNEPDGSKTTKTHWTKEDQHHNHFLDPEWQPTGNNGLATAMNADSEHSSGYDDTKSLFENMSQRYVELYQKEYGEHDFYLADAFEEMYIPPSTDKPTYFNKVGNALYRGIEKATLNNQNGSAVFAFQGWNLGFQRRDWNPDSLEGFLKDIPDNKVFIIDQAEDYNEWSWHNNANFKYFKKDSWADGQSFGGKKWTYCTIPNMGGNTAVTGNLEWYGHAGPDALDTQGHGYLFAYGSAPEGIDTNPVTQELISDMGWRRTSIDIKNGSYEGYVGNNWLANYDINRYGFESKSLRKYWLGRLSTANSYLDDHPIHKWQLKGWGTWTAPDSDGWLMSLQAFKEAAKEREGLKNTPLFRDDLFRMTNIYLGIILDRKLTEFEATSDIEECKKIKAVCDDLFDTMNRLTATHNTDRLERWLKMARWWGDTPEQKNYFESDAKYHLSLWYPTLEDYASKHWGGMIGYYKQKMDALMNRDIEGANGESAAESKVVLDPSWITERVSLPKVSLPWVHHHLTGTDMSPIAFDSPYAEALKAMEKYTIIQQNGLKPHSYSTLMSNPYKQNLTDIKTEFTVTTQQLQNLSSLTIFSKIKADSMGHWLMGNPVIDTIEIEAGAGIVWKHRNVQAALNNSPGNAEALTFKLEGLPLEVASDSNNGAVVRITWRASVFTNAKLQLFVNDEIDPNDKDKSIVGATTYKTFNNGVPLNNEIRVHRGTMHFSHDWPTTDTLLKNPGYSWTGKNDFTVHLGFDGQSSPKNVGNVISGVSQFVALDAMDDTNEPLTFSIQEADGSWTALPNTEGMALASGASANYDLLNNVQNIEQIIKVADSVQGSQSNAELTVLSTPAQIMANDDAVAELTKMLGGHAPTLGMLQGIVSAPAERSTHTINRMNAALASVNIKIDFNVVLKNADEILANDAAMAIMNKMGHGVTVDKAFIERLLGNARMLQLVNEQLSAAKITIVPAAALDVVDGLTILRNTEQVLSIPEVVNALKAIARGKEVNKEFVDGMIHTPIVSSLNKMILAKIHYKIDATPQVAVHLPQLDEVVKTYKIKVSKQGYEDFIFNINIQYDGKTELTLTSDQIKAMALDEDNLIKADYTADAHAFYLCVKSVDGHDVVEQFGKDAAKKALSTIASDRSVEVVYGIMQSPLAERWYALSDSFPETITVQAYGTGPIAE